MTRAEISGISPFFIVSHVPSSLAFYRDQLGFEVTFQGPSPDDIFFGIVRRGGAQILLKDASVTPLPNCTLLGVVLLTPAMLAGQVAMTEYHVGFGISLSLPASWAADTQARNLSTTLRHGE